MTLDFQFLRMPVGRRLLRLAPLLLPYLGYSLYHLIWSPVLSVNGILRARRRAYKPLLWGRFWGGPRVPKGRSIVMLCGGLGELRLANQFAQEISELHRLPVALLAQTEFNPPPDLHGTLGAAPFNNPFSVLLFLRNSRPMAIFAPEFCDNIHLKFALRVLGIPLVIFNVNTTEREVERLKRFSSWRWQLGGVYVTQNEIQRSRLLRMRVSEDQAFTFGSIGVYLEPPADMPAIRAKWASILGPLPGPVVLAGSTHAEDEAVVVPAWEEFVSRHERATLILAVRNRLRFDEVEAVLRDRGIRVVRRSSGQTAPTGGVFMLDSYGELAEIYCAADVAFIGATYDHWRGGHTSSEALVWGVPLTLGPNFQQHTNVCDVLIERGIARVAHDAAELSQAWTDFVSDPKLREDVANKTADLSQRGRQLGRDLFRSVFPGSAKGVPD